MKITRIEKIIEEEEKEEEVEFLGDNFKDFDFALIGCSRIKKDTSEGPLVATELYNGNLFRLAKEFCGYIGIDFFILSSLYGLVIQGQELMSYDLRITELNSSERRSWAVKVVRTLNDLFPLRGKKCLFLAGADYFCPIKSIFVEVGVEVALPLKGLGIGSQMKWFKDNLERKKEV